MKRYKPLIDKLFWIVTIPTVLLTAGGVAVSVYSLPALLIMIGVAVFVGYFLVSPLFGYVELGENALYIKYGFIMKKEIPYSKIRGIEKDRKFLSESMMSLKNAFDHVNIKYNAFDVTTLSVVNNDAFVSELEKKVSESCNQAE